MVDYLFMANRVGARHRPDLNLKKTIDYELGFAKRISKIHFKKYQRLQGVKRYDTSS